MKKWLFCFVVSFLLIPYLSFCEEIYGVAKFDFSIRSNPSFDGLAVKKVRAGEKIGLSEKAGNWLKTADKEKSGWIAINWIVPYGDLSKLQSSKNLAFKKIDSEINYTPFSPPLYGNSRLRVFAKKKPSIQSNSSAWLKEGERLIILGVQDDWFKIKTEDKKIAWIGSNLVDVTASSAESVQKIIEQNKQKAQILKLKSEFNELSPSEFNKRLDILREILKLDKDDDDTRKLAEKYGKKITEIKINELEARVKSLPASDIQGNLKIYKKLVSLDPKNPIYQEKVEHYSYKFKERKKKDGKAFEEKEKRNQYERVVSDLEILSWNWRQLSDSYVEATGMVKNISGSPLNYVKTIVSWFTVDGTFITYADAYIEFKPLMPNQESPFRVIVSYNPLMSKASIKFSMSGKQLKAFKTE